MTFDVYKVSLDWGTARTHSALFVEAEENNTGYLIHVIGNVQDGYKYDVYSGDYDWGTKAEHVKGYLGKELLGTVEEANLMDFMDTCGSVQAPGIQMNSFGVKIDKSVPFYRDGEWLDDVIQKLKTVGLLQVV